MLRRARSGTFGLLYGAIEHPFEAPEPKTPMDSMEQGSPSFFFLY